MIVCSPNNPTGNGTPVDVVAELLEKIEGVLFLDNAYVEFSDYDYLPLMKKYENLILGRTFSKIYSLAGLRIGYTFVPSMVRALVSACGSAPFTVNSVSAAAAAAALPDRDHAQRYAGQVNRWRKLFTTKVKYAVLPSDANFVMIDVAPRTGDEMVDELARRELFCRLLPEFCRTSGSLHPCQYR